MGGTTPRCRPPHRLTPLPPQSPPSLCRAQPAARARGEPGGSPGASHLPRCQRKYLPSAEMSRAGFPGLGDPWRPAGAGDSEWGGRREAGSRWKPELAPWEWRGRVQYLPALSASPSAFQIEGIHMCLALRMPGECRCWGCLCSGRCRGAWRGGGVSPDHRAGGPQHLSDSERGGQGPGGCPATPRAAPLPSGWQPWSVLGPPGSPRPG